MTQTLRLEHDDVRRRRELADDLGSLVTIANQAPTNLVHCLCENGCYETNGSVPIPRAGQIRFAELAKTAGYP